MTWGAIGSAAVGVVGSALLAPDGSQTSTATKEPWGPAQDWMRSNIEQGQQLQDYYTQNPFNAIQQQGMQGLLDNYNHQNNTVIPGLMGFANKLMGTNYQRGAPTAGLLAAPQPQQGSMVGQMPAQSQQPMQAAPQPAMQGGFSPPPTQAGAPINWTGMNPLYKDPAAAPAPYQPTDAELFRQNMADALFPESGSKAPQYGVSGPSASELYLRNLLGRPSNYVDIAG